MLFLTRATKMAKRPKSRTQLLAEGYLTRPDAAAYLRETAQEIREPRDGRLLKISFQVWFAQPEVEHCIDGEEHMWESTDEAHLMKCFRCDHLQTR